MTLSFSIPRSIIYGENALEHLATLKGKKAALVTGGSSMKRFGFFGQGHQRAKESRDGVHRH